MAEQQRACHVYVLYSTRTRRFYIGTTDELAKRLQQHNEGVSRWTRGRGPWELVWSQAFPDRTAARRFERLLKRQKGATGFYSLTGLSPEGFGRGESNS